ncbi:MAG: flavodoxin domain-containing protein [Anaerolineae bacterium]|nr:flavodoxin domain-containing protein [Anaerolineae bacterium]
MNILVGYASAHGSTAEIARFMGAIFQEHHFQVHVADVESLGAADGYAAVILGSAIHAGTILPSMRTYVRRHKDDLTLKSVYFWIACIRVIEPGGCRHARENYIPYEIAPGINPARVAAFSGRVELAELQPGERWALALDYDGTQPSEPFDGDYRDWDAIRAWTLEVAAELSTPQSSSESSIAAN